MSLRLRVMTEAEFEEWRVRTAAAYAEEVAEAMRLTPEQATATSEASFRDLLPQGVSTPNHSVCAIEDSDGAVVGQLWIAEEHIDGRARLYVYDVEITPSERGRGFGRETMLLVESEARSRGLDRIELSVFPGNHVAHALYRSLDFEGATLRMVKLLD